MPPFASAIGFQALRTHLRQRFQGWVRRRIPPARRVVLTHHNIFILPSQQGLAFGVVLVLMFLGAVNYEASLAFALVFLLLGMFLLSIFYTFRNLAGLEISAIPGTRVFAGENAEVTVILARHGPRNHEAVQVNFPGSRAVVTDLIETTEQRLNLYVPATRRGYLVPGRLTVATVFPFGLCRAWSLIDLDIHCLVYPRPAACDLEWLFANQLNAGITNVMAGSDDFYGLREYRQGDSLKHVAWKHVASGQGLYTKQFASHADDRLWLDWDMFAGMGTEDRLSRLCYCVLELDRLGHDYGLRLPGLEIAPGRGTSHYQQVMEALALYGIDETSARQGDA